MVLQFKIGKSIFGGEQVLRGKTVKERNILGIGLNIINGMLA